MWATKKLNRIKWKQNIVLFCGLTLDNRLRTIIIWWFYASWHWMDIMVSLSAVKSAFRSKYNIRNHAITCENIYNLQHLQNHRQMVNRFNETFCYSLNKSIFMLAVSVDLQCNNIMFSDEKLLFSITNVFDASLNFISLLRSCRCEVHVSM